MHMQVDLMWWAEAPVTVAHIINRAPTINRPALFTWGVLADEKLNLKYLCVFGSSRFHV